MVLGAALLAVLGGVSAKPSLVYAGNYPANVKAVRAANIVEITAQVWSGFDRYFKVTLSGIAVPQVTEKAPNCQKKLAREAEEFTRHFLKHAKSVEVHSIRMSDSTKPDANALIFTEKGSLAEQLKKKGLARSDKIKEDEPWCA